VLQRVPAWDFMASSWFMGFLKWFNPNNENGWLMASKTPERWKQ
jgi:hypothetical protein